MTPRGSTDPIEGAIISYRRRRQIKRWVEHAILAVGLFVILFPIYWTFSTSIQPDKTIKSLEPRLLPTEFTFEHYRYLLEETLFVDWFINSLVVSGGVIGLTVTFATLGGYGLTRLDISFKRTFARGVLVGYMFPPILFGIPMFIIWQRLGIINSHIGLVLAETALALPFSLWLMWNFFQTVPYSLEESAQMAGASRFRAFIDIALPMAKPGVIAVIVYAFAVSWNEYTLARILLSDRSVYVITIGLDTLINDNLIDWGPMMAMSFVAIVPPLLLMYFLQKYLIRGFRVAR